MRVMKFIFIGVLVIFAQFGVSAQTLPVGTAALEDYYRRAQLLGITDTNVSFTVRPVFPNYIKKGADTWYPDTTEQRYNLINTNSSWQSANKRSSISILPVSFQTQFNSDHPYG